MKITITGSTGFIGRNLIQFLMNESHECLTLSMRDADFLSQIDKCTTAIIHLAGKAHDISKETNGEEYFKINRDLTIALFEEFLNSEIQYFFFFSSVKAAADQVEGILTEEHHPSPITPYGKSKFEAEQYLLSQNLPKDKRLFIIRPCLVHGPGNKGNLNLLYKIVKKGIPWPLASFINERSFLSIENLCYLIHAMLECKELKSGVYHFADDKAISTNRLIEIIAFGLKKKPRFLHFSEKTIIALAKIGNILHLPLNSDRLKKLTESYVVSNQKIKTALEIKSLPLTTEEGLIKTIKSFSNN